MQKKKIIEKKNERFINYDVICTLIHPPFKQLDSHLHPSISPKKNSKMKTCCKDSSPRNILCHFGVDSLFIKSHVTNWKTSNPNLDLDIPQYNNSHDYTIILRVFTMPQGRCYETLSPLITFSMP